MNEVGLRQFLHVVDVLTVASSFIFIFVLYFMALYYMFVISLSDTFKL